VVSSSHLVGGAVRIILASASSSVCPSIERRRDWIIAVRSGCSKTGVRRVAGVKVGRNSVGPFLAVVPLIAYRFLPLVASKLRCDLSRSTFCKVDHPRLVCCKPSISFPGSADIAAETKSHRSTGCWTEGRRLSGFGP